MTWSDLSMVFHDGLEKLPPLRSGDLLELEVDWSLKDAEGPELFDLLKKTDPRVEEAIRQFSRERRWPFLTLEERMILQWRLETALEATQVLGAAARGLGLPDELHGENDPIEWALIRFWHEAGVAQRHGTIEALHRGFVAALRRRN